MNPIYNIIAVGARSFGKTSLVGAIKGVPGFSPVVGRQRVEDFRRDSIVGESSPTQKKDGITVWKFESRRNKYFRLNIFDCAGEFFKDEEEDGIGHNSDEVQKSSGKWLSFDFWQNRFRLRKLDRTIRQIDAMLVLLPANWEGVDRQDLDAYVAKVCRWIRQRRDGFPVWFVVNKCDVLNDEVLAKIKEAADIRDLIEGSKLQKTYRAIRDAISVDGEREVHFGIISVYPRTQSGWTKLKKDQLVELDDLSEDEAAPFNVRALLMEIADVADHERGKNFVKAWDVAPWWKRMFLHPFMCLSIVGKGSSDKDLYKKMRSIRWGAWLRFCSFAFGLVMVAAASILAAASFVEWREESKFETELAENKKALPEVTRDRLIQYDDYLASNIWIRPIFFQFRLIKLRADLVDLKTNYVNWLEKDLRDELRDARKVRMDYWEVAPSNNIERAKARTEAIKGHLARLPRDFRSACIESNQVEEAKYISDFTNDIEFIEALYALRSVERRDKCRAMVRIKKKHNAQSRIRESDFNRLDSEICKLEQVLSSELSNCIARIERDNSGETWEAKVSRYTKEVELVTNNITSFVEGSDVFEKWMRYAAEKISAIEHEKKYGPFDIECDSLIKTLTDDWLTRYQGFLNKFKRDDYKEREDEYRKIEGIASQRRCDITNAIVTVSRKFRDDKNGDMTPRIEAAGKRIREWEKVLKRCVKGSAEYSQFETMIRDESQWIDDHRKYVNFDDDYKTNVLSCVERERVRPMMAFLNDHKSDMYPEYTNRLDKIVKRQKEINDSLMEGLNKKLKESCDNAGSKSWQTQETACIFRSELIKKYEDLVDDASREALRKLKEKEDAAKGAVKRMGKFNDRYDELMKSSDRRFLHQAKKFRDDFNQKDFQDRADCYTNIIISETNLIARIAATNKCLIAALSKPAATNFVARLERSRKIQEFCEDALEYFPAGHEGAALYSNQVQRARVEATQCTRWIKIRKSMEAIKEDAKSEPKIRLLKIGSFFEKYSKDDNVEQELVWIYDEIGDMQRNAESEFVQTIEGKLSQLQIKGTEKDNLMQEVLKKRIEVFKNALQYLVKGSKMANTYKNRLASEIKRLSDEEMAGVFRRDYEQLKKDIGRINSASKIIAIDGFLRSHPKNIYVSLGFVNEYAQLEMDRKRFKEEQDWESVKSEVVKFLERPSKSKEGEDGFRSEMRDCRNTAAEYETQISRHEKSEFFASEAKALKEKLQKKKAEIDRRIGTGSWQDIVDAEKRFKKDPSEANYQDLMDRISGFKKDENKEFIDKCNAAKDNLDAYRDLEKKVLDKRRDFKMHPGRGSYSELKNAINSLGVWLEQHKDYQVMNETLNRISTWIKDVDEGRVVVGSQIKWVGYDFRGTSFHAKSGDHELKLELNNVLKSAIHDVYDDQWNCISSKYKLWAVNWNNYPLVFDGRIGSTGMMSFRLTDLGRTPDQAAGGVITFWDLVARDNSDFDYSLNLKMEEGDMKSNGPSITLHFCDIPVCP